MEQHSVSEIIELCAVIDQRAIELYQRMASVTHDPSLRVFWTERAGSIRAHHQFLETVGGLADDGLFPQIFPASEATAMALRRILGRVRALGPEVDAIQRTESAFLLAYRLESDLLHPAFEILFHYGRNLVPMVFTESPEDDYPEHLAHFARGLEEFGIASPELDTIGTLLAHLWESNRRLALEATTDPLTGLLDRRGFLDLAHPLAHLSRRNELPLAVLLVNVDYFKQINERWGHARGDRVLREVAGRLRATIRDTDLVCRWGGDEFGVLLYPVAADALRTTADKIRYAISSPPFGDLRISACVGAAATVFDEDVVLSLDRLLAVADGRLLEAKEEGRDRAVVGEDDPYA
jgi:diguanylate cyclase (GGDEF)-like protein